MKSADDYNSNSVLKEAYELGYGLSIGIVIVTLTQNGDTLAFRAGCSVTSVASARRSGSIVFTAEIAEEAIQTGEVTESILEEGTTASRLAEDIAFVTTVAEYSTVIAPTEDELSAVSEPELEDCDNAACTPTAVNESDEGGGGGDTGLIIGLVVGLVGGFALIVVAIFIFIKYRAGATEDAVDLEDVDLENSDNTARSDSASKDVGLFGETIRDGSEDLSEPLSPKSAQAAREANAHSQL